METIAPGQQSMKSSLFVFCVCVGCGEIKFLSHASDSRFKIL